MDREQFHRFEQAFRFGFPLVYDSWIALRTSVHEFPEELVWARDFGLVDVYRWSDGFPIVPGVSNRMRFFAGASLLPLRALRERASIFQNGAIPVLSDFAGLHGLLVPGKGAAIYFDDPEMEMEAVSGFDSLSAAFDW